MKGQKVGMSFMNLRKRKKASVEGVKGTSRELETN